MSTGSKIEWTEATWNPVTGCLPVSPGCRNCYAAVMSHRLDGMGQKKYAGLTVLENGWRHFNGEVHCHDDVLQQPLHWRKPRTIFVCSMADLYHPKVPNTFRDKVHAVMELCPQHTFQVLTKRPELMAEYCARRSVEDDHPSIIEASNQLYLYALPASHSSAARWDLEHLHDADGWTWDDNDYDGPELEMLNGFQPPDSWAFPFANIWLGTTCENQEAADKRIPHLLKCPAAVRFLSLEPLLGPIDLSPWLGDGGCAKCGWRGFSRDDFEGFPNQPCYRWLHDDEEDREEGLVCPSCEEQAIATMPPPDFAPDIDGVIVGGESGPGARPCEIEDIRSIIRQSRAAGVPVFVKQLGANPTLNGKPLKLKQRNGKDIGEWPADLRIRELVNHTN